MIRKKRYRASAVVVSNNELLTVLLEDPHTKITNFFIPGGKVEENESPELTAKRETFEESGINISVIPGSEIVITYPFTWNNELIECTTAFYAATCTDRTIPKNIRDASYNFGAQWLPISEIDEKMSFDRRILEPVKQLIANYFNQKST